MMTKVESGNDRRQEIAEAAADVLLRKGLGDLSLRGIAREIGTSHRMLLYHFESKEDLLVAAFDASRVRQREMVRNVLERHLEASLPEQVERLWEWLISAEVEAAQRLFFEIYGRALRHPEHFPGFLERVVTDWLADNETFFRSAGFPPDAARDRATLLVATIRGLMLDYLGSPDRERVNAAIHAYIAELKALLNKQPQDSR